MSKLKTKAVLVGKTTTYAINPFRNRSIKTTTWYLYVETAKKVFRSTFGYMDSKAALNKVNQVNKVGSINTIHWIELN